LPAFRALCRCITVVFQGQYWANNEQMGYVIDALNAAPSSRVINVKGEGILTPREEQIVNLVAEGIGNREIAQQLGIKENTVKKSLLRTYDKLGVSNRVELVLYALTHRGCEGGTPQNSKPPPLSSRVATDCVCGNSAELIAAPGDTVLKN
jgi:DNA-binding NarL/FixJ family response regulator